MNFKKYTKLGRKFMKKRVKIYGGVPPLLVLQTTLRVSNFHPIVLTEKSWKINSIHSEIFKILVDPYFGNSGLERFSFFNIAPLRGSRCWLGSLMFSALLPTSSHPLFSSLLLPADAAIYGWQAPINSVVWHLYEKFLCTHDLYRKHWSEQRMKYPSRS